MPQAAPYDQFRTQCTHVKSLLGILAASNPFCLVLLHQVYATISRYVNRARDQLVLRLPLFHYAEDVTGQCPECATDNVCNVDSDNATACMACFLRGSHDVDCVRVNHVTDK